MINDIGALFCDHHTTVQTAQALFRLEPEYQDHFWGELVPVLDWNNLLCVLHIDL